MTGLPDLVPASKDLNMAVSRPTIARSALVLALCFCSSFAAEAAERNTVSAIAAVQVRMVMSALGDLSPYRTIASDTLAIVGKGDIPAARTRIKDLETSWDKAEATLKPKDKATWTRLDGLIDAALADLRTPNPKPAACAASLKVLIAEFDTIDKA